MINKRPNNVLLYTGKCLGRKVVDCIFSTDITMIGNEYIVCNPDLSIFRGLLKILSEDEFLNGKYTLLRGQYATTLEPISVNFSNGNFILEYNAYAKKKVEFINSDTGIYDVLVKERKSKDEYLKDNPMPVFYDDIQRFRYLIVAKNMDTTL